MKSNIKLFVGILIGIVICGISVYAAEEIINAKDIRYKTKTVEDSLNELYIKANAKDVGALKFCKFIDGTYGSFGEIGSKYECEVGNNITYNFYLLAQNNANSVDLIMDRNINSGTMSWDDAIKYFKIGDGASAKTAWNNVLNIDLPKVQEISDAVRNDDYIVTGDNVWCFSTKTQTNSCNSSDYAWLYNHLNNCTQYGCSDASNATANGYWTRDLTYQSNQAYRINYDGTINQTSPSYNSAFGVRPVITVLKSNLYSE